MPSPATARDPRRNCQVGDGTGRRVRAAEQTGGPWLIDLSRVLSGSGKDMNDPRTLLGVRSAPGSRQCSGQHQPPQVGPCPGLRPAHKPHLQKGKLRPRERENLSQFTKLTSFLSGIQTLISVAPELGAQSPRDTVFQR